jgi:hypothetical protein
MANRLGWKQAWSRPARRAAKIAWLSVAIAATSPLLGSAQEKRLLVAIDGHASTPKDSIDSKEILSVVPGRGEPASVWIDRANWPVLLGDQNHDGRLADSPARVDALEVIDPTLPDPTVFDLVLSIGADRVFLDGTLVRDGDAFSLLPGGGVRIWIPESQLRAWVATEDDVDLDGLAFLSDGSVAFTFDEPVASADRDIIERNGGGAFLDDESIFLHRPGQARAELYRSSAEIVSLVARVLGTAYLSVLDVQGLAEDPSEPGALLFSTGLFSGPGASQIFTTARGGDRARLNEVGLSAPAFGFLDAIALADFALTGAGSAAPPVSLSVGNAEPSITRDGAVLFRLEGRPGERVHLFASHAAVPLPIPQRNGALGSAGYLFLDASDPLVPRTARMTSLSFLLDGNGALDVRLALRPRAPAGTLLLFQAASEDRREGSYGVAVRLLP